MKRRIKYNKYLYWIDSSDIRENIKAKSIKGGINTTSNQIISFSLNLISTFILARILLPEDFGLIGMVTAFTGFANVIKDVGLSTAVIQKEKITHKQISNLFWINILICVLLGGLFAALSPLIVLLYHNDARIYPIIFSYGVGIAISGFSIQHTALLSRKMHFGKIAKANISATILSVICGILAGIMGLGYWAIVILNLSLLLFNTLFLWHYCNWRPDLPTKGQKIKDYLTFGAGISGFNIINYFSRYSDDILIGNRLGPVSVGFYTKAYQLLMLPINQLRNPLMTVALPAMSKLTNDGVKYRSYYKKYVFILAFFSMPLIATLMIFSKEVILIVLGSHWLESGRIFQILAIAGFIQPVSSSSGLVMISTGQTKKFFIIGCISSLVIVSGFFVGIHWGVIGTAISFVITTYLILVPTLYWSFKKTPLTVSLFFSEISRPFLHTLGMCVLILPAHLLLTTFIPELVAFIILAPTGLLFYYLSWKLFKHTRDKLSSIEEIMDLIFNKIKVVFFPAKRLIKRMALMNR
jgi:PST family polysaccharide transporter